MPGNFLQRLGDMLRAPIRFPGQHEEPKPEEPAPAEAVAEAAPAEVVAEAAPAEAPAAESYEAVAAETPTEAPAAEAAPEPVAVAPAEPQKSAEEIEEEKLWQDAHAAWAREDFAAVTTALNRLRTLEPEHAEEIDQTLASANYNWAAKLEERGQTQAALSLYRQALRRNANLGEAQAAIDRLTAPPPAPEPVAEAAAPEPRTVTVESGDTLSAIAERAYGDANAWPRIFEANRDVLNNPDMIHPGQVLRIPE